MQPGYDDYYEWNDDGCCLICKNGYDGCLCYECKCRQCYWYNDNQSCCDLPDVWRYEREEVWENGQNYYLKVVDVWQSTDKALLARIERKNGTTTERMWIPKSCLNDDNEI